LVYDVKGHLMIVDDLSRKLDFQIGMNRTGSGHGFRQPGTYCDHGKLRAPRRLHHVEVAIAVPRVERLNWYCDQEIALASVADTFAACGVADSIDLMKRMGNMVGKTRLIQNPLAVCGGKSWQGEKQDGGKCLCLHQGCSEFQRNGQKRSPIRSGCHDGHRGVCAGGAMDPLAAAFLLVSHHPEDRRQNHAWTVNPGERLVQADGSPRWSARYLGSEDGIRGGSEIQAGSRAAQSGMQVACGRTGTPPSGHASGDYGRHQRSKGYQPKSLMNLQHVRPFIETCLFLSASLGLLWRESEIPQRGFRLDAGRSIGQIFCQLLTGPRSLRLSSQNQVQENQVQGFH